MDKEALQSLLISNKIWIHSKITSASARCISYKRQGTVKTMCNTPIPFQRQQLRRSLYAFIYSTQGIENNCDLDFGLLTPRGRLFMHLPQGRFMAICTSSSRMRVINHNWSATKQRPHPQSVAEISRHSVLSGDRIRQCETSSGSRHKDTDQCL